MSDNQEKKDISVLEPIPNLPTVSGRDLQNYIDFKNAGFPAISSLPRESIPKMLDMYLDGFSHREIARFFRVKIEIVFYHADKDNWYSQLMVNLKDLEDSAALKLHIYQNKTPDFYMALGGFIRKNLQTSIDQYKKTGDIRILDSINTSLVDKIVKIDTFLKEASNNNPNKDTNINVNLFNNTSQKENDAIDVTPNSGESLATADVLRAIADLKRKNQADKKK
jgi:hypothetical protein